MTGALEVLDAAIVKLAALDMFESANDIRKVRYAFAELTQAANSFAYTGHELTRLYAALAAVEKLP